MIKLQMHQTTLEGKPLSDTGKVLSGADAYEVIEAMKLQSPFTADMTARQYIDNILAKIMPEGEATELDATEFLSKLAEQGFISFLPEDDHYPSNLMEVLETIRQSGATNMLDAPVVAGLAIQMGETEVADWIESHRREYAEIIFNGRPNRETREVKPCADNAE
ncbi:MAG: DUF5049 domain-containing protein [Victivallaceae bacterium]|nr:DUF5049 domain-containing protein [Victivallaceae bacterium]